MASINDIIKTDLNEKDVPTIVTLRCGGRYLFGIPFYPEHF